MNLHTANRRAIRSRNRGQTLVRAYWRMVKEVQDEMFADLRRFNEEWRARLVTWESARARDPGLATGGVEVMTHV